MAKPPLLTRSALTGEWYIVTAYTDKGNGLIVARTKHALPAEQQAELSAAADAADDLERARRIAVALEQENAELTARVERVRALHPRIDNPRHGCCAPPKLCNGHGPECGGMDHGGSIQPAWPCPTLRALDAPAEPAEDTQRGQG